MSYRGNILLLIFILVGGISCENKPVTIDANTSAFKRGVFIVNEGQFLSANSSISFYNPLNDSVYHDVFYRANQVPLGDVATSMSIWQDNAFVVVNNSGKIYRCSKDEMIFRGKLNGLVSPRYILIAEDEQNRSRGYISDLYSGKIMVVDPLDDSILDSIIISKSTERLSSEQMIFHDGNLYVTCWSYGREILVIDINTNQITAEIELGKQPNSMVIDKHGDLWVLSDGGFEYSSYGQEKASLARINTTTQEVETLKIWDDIRVSPTDLCINGGGDTLYFIGEGIHQVPISSMKGFSDPLIHSNSRQFYSLGIDPEDGIIYVGDAVDYQQDGWVYRYRSSGAAIDSFRVGVNPGYFCFSYGEQH